METANELDALIVRSPEVLGGKPCVRGHRVAVHRIVRWWQLGLSMEEIAEQLPTLTPAELHTALAYYHLHKSEIDGYLEADQVALEALQAMPKTA